jgi:hypothetical protein
MIMLLGTNPFQRSNYYGRGFGGLSDTFTVVGYEGDEYIKTQKANSWRWENETGIHLPDGRVFGTRAEAIGANGPQWIEIRRPVAATTTTTQPTTTTPTTTPGTGIVDQLTTFVSENKVLVIGGAAAAFFLFGGMFGGGNKRRG